MDKKLLNALDNLSLSLELIADALLSKESSNSSTTNALKSGDFGKQLTEINSSLKSIKSDTSLILKNQSAILEVAKDKKEESKEDKLMSNSPDSLKKGAVTILLIAGAVLAIGMAFKLIGKVDFLSVISLGLAIVFISEAFSKISKLALDNQTVLRAAIAMTIMSGAIMLSSWILGYVRPLTLTQALTSIMIAGVFTVIAYGMEKMINAMGGNNMANIAKSVIFLPLILPAIALGIALASYSLSLIKPIGFSQAISAIMIAAIFTVMSFGIRKLLKSVDGANVGNIVLVSIMMPLLAGAIAASSLLIGLVQPISISQFITSIAISILFVALGYGIGLMAPALDKIKWSHLVMLPILFTTMSLAIMASSKILSQMDDISIGQSFKILLFGGVLTLLTFTMGTAMVLLGKASIKDILAGALAIVVLSGAIALSSKLLSMGDYEKYPDYKWAIGTGLSLGAFGIAAVALGLLVTSGIGAVALLAGAVAIVGLAATIVAVSHILKAGSYEKYPTLSWSAGVGLSLAAFGVSMLALGGVIVGSLGLGLVALKAGRDAVLMVAQSIVDVSFVLKKGDYSGGPTLAWSGGVALAIGAFSPVYAMLAANKVMSLFGGGVGPKDFSDAIKVVAGGIVVAAEEFNKSSVAFNNGPKKEWAEGVGLAIGAFSPVYGMLIANKFTSWFGGEVGPEQFVSAIKMVSEGIIAVGKIFDGETSFNDGPKAEWSEGVGGAIGAFLPIFEMVKGSKGLFSSGMTTEEMTSSMVAISNTMVDVGRILDSKYLKTKIDPNFIKNLSSSTLGFVDLADKLAKKGGSKLSKAFGMDSISQTASGMVKLAGAYDKLANSLKKFSNALNSINSNKASSLSRLTGNLALLASMNRENLDLMLKALEEKSGIFNKLVDDKDSKEKASVGDIGKGNKEVMKKNVAKSKYGNTAEQLDIVIDLLARIDNSTTSLDEYLAEKGLKPVSLTGTQTK